MTVVHTASVEADEFCTRLHELGYDHFGGVPCSLLKPIYAALERQGAPCLAATREDLAIGVAAGVALAGGSPVVLMQNSGLGVSLNAVLSLTAMYELPLLLVVSWRGAGPDAPEHLAMGALTEALLAGAGIPSVPITEPEARRETFHARRGPKALLVRAEDLR